MRSALHGSKVKSRSITWWGCKNCGRQHLAQHDAVETLSSLMDKMTVNCLCYGALGSLLLYPILDELVHGFLRIGHRCFDRCHSGSFLAVIFLLSVMRGYRQTVRV